MIRIANYIRKRQSTKRMTGGTRCLLLPELLSEAAFCSPIIFLTRSLVSVQFSFFCVASLTPIRLPPQYLQIMETSVEGYIWSRPSRLATVTGFHTHMPKMGSFPPFSHSFSRRADP